MMLLGVPLPPPRIPPAWWFMIGMALFAVGYFVFGALCEPGAWEVMP